MEYLDKSKEFVKFCAVGLLVCEMGNYGVSVARPLEILY